jgi:hypothetical protein
VIVLTACGSDADGDQPDPYYCTESGAGATWCNDFDRAGNQAPPWGFAEWDVGLNVSASLVTEAGNRSLLIQYQEIADAFGSSGLVGHAGGDTVTAHARFRVPELGNKMQVLELYLGASLGADLELHVSPTGAISLEVHGDTSAGPFTTSGQVAEGEWFEASIAAELLAGSDVDVTLTVGGEVVLSDTVVTLPAAVTEVAVHAGLSPTTTGRPQRVYVDDVALFDP